MLVIGGNITSLIEGIKERFCRFFKSNLMLLHVAPSFLLIPFKLDALKSIDDVHVSQLVDSRECATILQRLRSTSYGFWNMKSRGSRCLLHSQFLIHSCGEDAMAIWALYADCQSTPAIKLATDKSSSISGQCKLTPPPPVIICHLTMLVKKIRELTFEELCVTISMCRLQDGI